MPPEGIFVAEAHLRIRYAETDSMGVVHHRNYVTFFEEGRSEYARQRGRPYSSFEEAGFLLMVAELRVRYHKPARYEQELIVITWLHSMQSRGLSFAYEILDAHTRELLVNGESRHICVTKEGKVARIPDMWHDWKPR